MTDAAGDLPISALTGDDVVRVAPEASFHDIADALSGSEIGAVVMGHGEQPDGIVSERDLVRALADRRDPATTTARDLAKTDLVWCDARASVQDVAREMMDRYVRHVLVQDGGRLIGIVSARDLLGVYASSGDEE